MVLEFISSLFSSGQKCSHKHVSLNKDFAYCPDCGALVENQWFIVKCSCCGIKQKAVVKNGKVVPVGNFCHNCGGEDYYVEKLDAIDFININYATLLRKESKPADITKRRITQCWVEATKRSSEPPLLLPVYQ